MNFKELISELENVPFSELRKKYEGYFEFVLFSQNLTKLYPVLERFFGQPLKPAGVVPDTDAMGHAERYGGIQKNQTLYFKKEGGMVNCALVWPWGDGAHATVKVAQGATGEQKR